MMERDAEDEYVDDDAKRESKSETERKTVINIDSYLLRYLSSERVC